MHESRRHDLDYDREIITMITDKVYIYNMQQADFYMTQGLIPVGAGIGKLGHAYVRFEKNVLYETLFAQWCKRTA